MKLSGFIVTLAVISLCSTSYAVVGESSFEFMLLGVGARASAMGEAFTAVSGDAGAPFFNPASAAKMNGTEFSFAHISYLEDVSIEQFSLLTRSKSLRYGLNLSIGSVVDIERRGDTPTDEPLGTFDEHNVTASFFIAAPITEKLAIGNSAKIAYEKLDLEDAYALALDIGAFYTLTPEIAIGGSIRNFGTKPKFVSESFDLPREYRIGASYRTPEESRYQGILLSADYFLPEWGNKSAKFNIGGEYNYENIVFLRAGSYFGYDSRSISVGGGLAYQSYVFDYAYVPLKNNLGDTHRFTLRIRL